MAREVEILVPVLTDVDVCIETLGRFNHVRTARTVDTYYYDPKRDDLKPDKTGRIVACMRVREQDGVDGGFVAYKQDEFDGDVWQYSNEFETAIDDPDAMKQIVKCLGLAVLTVVDCVKHVYLTPDHDKEIVFEQVKGLGNYIEVEKKGIVEEDEVAIVKEGLRVFLQNQLMIEIGEELNSGKPELMLRAQGGMPLE